jgi:hypothetical protein
MATAKPQTLGHPRWQLTLGEAHWLCGRFIEYRKRLPSARRFQPIYDAGSWTLSALFEAFRRDATASGERVQTFLIHRLATGAWPKMKTSEAFWLRARWEMADRYCREVAGIAFDSSPGVKAGVSPKDVQAVTSWLLVELWDTRLVEIWIREHARDYVSVSDNTLDGSRIELERYLDELESL